MPTEFSQKTLDQLKIYLGEATSQLLSLSRLVENMEKELTEKND